MSKCERCLELESQNDALKVEVERLKAPMKVPKRENRWRHWKARAEIAEVEVEQNKMLIADLTHDMNEEYDGRMKAEAEMEEWREKYAQLESKCYDDGFPTGGSVFDELEKAESALEGDNCELTQNELAATNRARKRFGLPPLPAPPSPSGMFAGGDALEEDERAIFKLLRRFIAKDDCVAKWQDRFSYDGKRPPLIIPQDDLRVILAEAIHDLRARLSQPKPRVMPAKWMGRLFEALIYHEGTNDAEGVYWPVAKQMLREVGVEVDGAGEAGKAKP